LYPWWYTNLAIFLATAASGQVTNAEEYSPSEALEAMRKRLGKNLQYPASEATNKPRKRSISQLIKKRAHVSLDQL